MDEFSLPSKKVDRKLDKGWHFLDIAKSDGSLCADTFEARMYDCSIANKGVSGVTGPIELGSV